ncbi:MAG: phytanoyl-CoA dioxygenase family protein [Caldilineaceae bacterium]|nr:phytanoyl-CoA dioxygenase family protein [Caldilineaceae bacterium]
MTITPDQRFAFDVQGYLHLQNALTPEEVIEYTQWTDEAAQTDINVLNADNPEGMRHQINRPVSRVIDADVRFASLLDHPVVTPFLLEFLGTDYRHIDNDLYYTYPGYQGGHWHRGVPAHATGHVKDGKFTCPMVKVFYCLTDVGPGEGEFVVIPGSHRAQFELEVNDRVDLPAQHIFDTVKAGDIIIFNEGLLHNGRPNPSAKTRKTIIVNFGRNDARVWRGYKPTPATLAQVSDLRRMILTNPEGFWS